MRSSDKVFRPLRPTGAHLAHYRIRSVVAPVRQRSGDCDRDIVKLLEEESIVRKNKTVRITFRITDEEAIDLTTMMSLEGFRSRSKFIRKRLFGRKIQRRKLISSEANICKQIEILRADIKKIGVNYNQVVKAVNTAVKLKGMNGQPVVSTRSMEYKLGGMKTLMEGILAKVCEIKEEITEGNTEDQEEEPEPAQ